QALGEQSRLGVAPERAARQLAEVDRIVAVGVPAGLLGQQQLDERRIGRRRLTALAQRDEAGTQARGERGVDGVEDLPGAAEVRRERRDAAGGLQARAM